MPFKQRTRASFAGAMLLTAVGMTPGLSIAEAEVVYSENFSEKSGDLWGWRSLHEVDGAAYVKGLIQWDKAAPANNDYDDGDAAQVLAFAEGMKATGDGVQGDGGLLLNLRDSTPGNEGIFRNLTWTMKAGHTIRLKGSLYNDTRSFSRFRAEIWNGTDNVRLAPSRDVRHTVEGYNRNNYVPIEFDVTYEVQPGDEGDMVQIRIIELGNDRSRHLRVDNVEVTVEPVAGE